MIMVLGNEIKDGLTFLDWLANPPQPDMALTIGSKDYRNPVADTHYHHWCAMRFTGQDIQRMIENGALPRSQYNPGNRALEMHWTFLGKVPLNARCRMCGKRTINPHTSLEE